MIEASEVVDLVMAIVLIPIIATSLRSMPRARRRYSYGGFIAIIAGYMLTILEGFWAPVLLNLLEHAAYAAAGVFAVLAILQFRRAGGSR